MHRWRRRSEPATAAEVPDVLDEYAQFLGGQFLERYHEDRDSAPDWVWVNVLAHASEELLATCAAAGGAPSLSSPRCVWDRTLSFLSQVLLDHAGRSGVPYRSSNTTSSSRSNCDWGLIPWPRRPSCASCSVASKSAKGPLRITLLRPEDDTRKTWWPQRLRRAR